MNLYILVEGQSEANVYPKWLAELIPDFIRIQNPYDVLDNNYVLYSCGGFPSILDEIKPAVEEMNEIKKFEYLLIVIDADELDVEDRKQEVLDVFVEEKLDFDLNKLFIIVQNRCFESWCLGNTRFFPSNIETTDFQICRNHYDVKTQDPEKMPRDTNIKTITTVAQYHAYYLKKMFAERKLTYKKAGCEVVGEGYYLEELIKRIENTTHLNTFRNFVSVLKMINEKVTVSN